MFLTGFIFASSIVYLLCLQGELMPPYGNAGKNFIVIFSVYSIATFDRFINFAPIYEIVQPFEAHTFESMVNIFRFMSVITLYPF